MFRAFAKMKSKSKKITASLMLTIGVLIMLTLFNTNEVRIFLLKEEDVFPLPVFKVKPLVIWTTDFHFAPPKDLSSCLEPMGVRFIDKSLDNYGPRCQPRKSCDHWRSLKVINPNNAMNLNHELIPRFYEAYKNDTEIKTVDAFACFHSSALCELYEPFNKSLIIIATIRYELGRHTQKEWTKWNQNLIKYASQPWNVVGANNLYDVEYMKYFTGIQPQLLPNWGNYTNQSYTGSRPGFIMAYCHNRPFGSAFYINYTNACKAVNCTRDLMTPLRQKYPFYKYSDIAAHQGLVYVPYQVSVMSFFEQYRMNIPIFAPSRQLLVDWEFNQELMYVRRWNWWIRTISNRSAIDPHPSQRSVPDPNSKSREAISYWVQFCDFYQFPHITYYDSIEDLIRILQSISKGKLFDISERMRRYNMVDLKRQRRIWRDILLKIASHSSNRPV